MAEVVAIKLELDAGQSVKEVQKLEDAIAEINNTSSSLTVDEKFEMLNSTLDTTTATFGEMSQAIESYKTIALNAGRESPVGQEALKRAGQLKDQIADIDKEVDNLALDSQNLQGALQIGSGVVAGYQAFSGVTALLGDENEALMETMVKLQSTMSVLQAIEQLRLATEKESVAIKTLNNVKTKIAIGLQKAYTFAVGTGSKAMKIFRLALISTGIGALAVLIGVIIAKWDDWKDTIMKFINKALSPVMWLLEKLGVIDDETERIRKKNHEAHMKRLEKEKSDLEAQAEVRDKRLNHEIALAQARGENSEEIEKELLQHQIDSNREILKGQEDKYREMLKNTKKYSDEELKEQRDLNEKLRGDIQGHERNLKVFNEKAETEKRKKRKSNWEKRKQEKQKEFEEELQMLRDKAQKELDLEQELQNLIIENMQDEDAKKLAQLKLQHARELNELRDKYGLETELEIELLKKQARELNEVKKQIAQESKDEMDEMANFFEQEEDARRDNEVAKNIAATKAQLTNLEETEKAKQQVRLASVDATKGILNGLASLFDKNEKVQKANALAQIAIDTAMGFVNGLNIAQKSAKATGPAAAFAFPLFYASQVGAVLSAAGQAKKILGAGGGSGVTPPSISRPNPTTTTSGTAPTGNNNNGRTDIPTTKVVLVESELQAMQTRRTQVDTIATI